MQDIRGPHFAIVEVVEFDGQTPKRTGTFMFVRYCSGCRHGLPLHLFRAGQKQCERCVDKRARSRLFAADRPPRAVDTDGEKWASHDAALVMEAPNRDGICRAQDCWNEVARRGAGPHNETTPLPLCADCIKVCPAPC